MPESQLFAHADITKRGPEARVGIDTEGEEVRQPNQGGPVEDCALCLFPHDAGRDPASYGALHPLVVAEHDHPALAILTDKIGRGGQEEGSFARSGERG